MLSKDDQYLLIGELTDHRHQILMSGKTLRSLQGPYLYSLFREQEILYTGVKTSSWERPFNPSHHAVGAECDVRPDDRLCIYPMLSPGIARWAEKIVLDRHEMTRNKQRFHTGTYDMEPLSPLCPEAPPSSRPLPAYSPLAAVRIHQEEFEIMEGPIYLGAELIAQSCTPISDEPSGEAER